MEYLGRLQDWINNMVSLLGASLDSSMFNILKYFLFLLWLCNIQYICNCRKDRNCGACMRTSYALRIEPKAATSVNNEKTDTKLLLQTRFDTVGSWILLYYITATICQIVVHFRHKYMCPFRDPGSPVPFVSLACTSITLNAKHLHVLRPFTPSL